MRDKAIQAVIYLIVLAVAARVVWELLEPLIAPLIVLAILGGIILWVLGGPRSK